MSGQASFALRRAQSGRADGHRDLTPCLFCRRGYCGVTNGPSNMSDNSKIEWADATWNSARGCTKISPGCAHGYAETFSERFCGVPGHPFEFGF